jgi:hypothetical protein
VASIGGNDALVNSDLLALPMDFHGGGALETAPVGSWVLALGRPASLGDRIFINAWTVPTGSM